MLVIIILSIIDTHTEDSQCQTSICCQHFFLKFGSYALVKILLKAFLMFTIHRTVHTSLYVNTIFILRIKI